MADCAQGYYDDFGARFIAETLISVVELRAGLDARKR